MENVKLYKDGKRLVVVIENASESIEGLIVGMIANASGIQTSPQQIPDIKPVSNVVVEKAPKTEELEEVDLPWNINEEESIKPTENTQKSDLVENKPVEKSESNISFPTEDSMKKFLYDNYDKLSKEIDEIIDDIGCSDIYGLFEVENADRIREICTELSSKL